VMVSAEMLDDHLKTYDMFVFIVAALWPRICENYSQQSASVAEHQCSCLTNESDSIQ